MAKKSVRVKANNREEYENNLYANKLSLKSVEPKTANQQKFFDAYASFDAVGAVGSAGTGKTYCALYLALRDIMSKSAYGNIIYVRTAVQTRDQGFMTGNLNEKMSYYETPLVDTVNYLMQNPEGYSILKRKGVIKFVSSSFIRGLTFKNSIVIFDECQSATMHEISSVITREAKTPR